MAHAVTYIIRSITSLKYFFTGSPTCPPRYKTLTNKVNILSPTFAIITYTGEKSKYNNANETGIFNEINIDIRI